MTSDRYIHNRQQNATILILCSCLFGKPTERPFLPSLQACSGGCHRALEISSAATPDPPPNRKHRRQDCLPEVRGPTTEICQEPTVVARTVGHAQGGTPCTSRTSRLAGGSAPLRSRKLTCKSIVRSSSANQNLNTALPKANLPLPIPNHFQQRSKSHPFPQHLELRSRCPCSSCEPAAYSRHSRRTMECIRTLHRLHLDRQRPHHRHVSSGTRF